MRFSWRYFAAVARVCRMDRHGKLLSRQGQKPSINASVAPGVAFSTNSRCVSPILPCHKSKCHQLVGAEVFDTAPDPAAELSTCSHVIMYLLTCKLAVSRLATAPVGSPNRPDFAGHMNRGGARRSHFCSSAWALRSDTDRSFVPRTTCSVAHTEWARSMASFDFAEVASRHHSDDTSSDGHSGRWAQRSM